MAVPFGLSASPSGTRRLTAQYGSTAVCEGRTNRPGADGSYPPEADIAQCNCGMARRQRRWSYALGTLPLDSSRPDRLHFPSVLKSICVAVALYNQAVIDDFGAAP